MVTNYDFNLNIINNDGYNCLVIVLLGDNLEIIQYIVNLKIVINIIIQEGCNALEDYENDILGFCNFNEYV